MGPTARTLPGGKLPSSSASTISPPEAAGGGAALVSLTPPALRAWLAVQGERAYRAEQILAWVYARGARDFDEMSNLPRGLRGRLTAAFVIPRLSPADVSRAT